VSCISGVDVLLREFEERNGGVLVEAAGGSIWLYM
jgi:hypothetical protein